MKRVQGIILAGGKSRRFGQDKALAMVHGISMIQRAVDALWGVELDVCVITSQTRDYSFLKCRVERDLIPEKGPLGGLLTAFSLFKGNTLLVLTCDMPMVSETILRSLIEAHQDSDQVTLYQIRKDMPEPFPGVYSSCLEPKIKECLDKNGLSISELIQSITNRKTLTVRDGSTLFINVNDQEAHANVLVCKELGVDWELKIG